MKNIQTGNQIETVTIGKGLKSVTSYAEIIEADRSWVYCSVDATGDYFAVLEEGIDTIAQVAGEACMDDALSSLEVLIDKMKEDGDTRPILDWNSPQILGL